MVKKIFLRDLEYIINPYNKVCIVASDGFPIADCEWVNCKCNKDYEVIDIYSTSNDEINITIK